MPTECPKCHYVRLPTDTAPAYECPRCGVVYAKVDAGRARGQQPVPGAGRTRAGLWGASMRRVLVLGFGGAVLSGLGFFMLRALAYLFIFVAPTDGPLRSLQVLGDFLSAPEQFVGARFGNGVVIAAIACAVFGCAAGIALAVLVVPRRHRVGAPRGTPRWVRAARWAGLGLGALGTVAVYLLVPPIATWRDEAVLHDGRSLDVRRILSLPYTFDSSGSSGRWPDQYALAARHPDTGSTVRWTGESGTYPILLDFWNGTAYLVVVAAGNLAKYGCPEIPYIFLRYDAPAGRWRQLAPGDFPPALLTANLSFGYYYWYMEGGKRQTKEDMGWRNAEAERSSRGFTMQAIPTDFASWQYRSKNSYRIEHYRHGCRHTVPSTADPSHPQSPGQPSQPVSLDVLETKVFDPAWVMSNEEWSALSWDKAQDTRCKAFVKHVGDESDTPTLRGWLLFVHDPTGRKKARPTGQMFCDGAALWFVDYAVERERTVLTKFTIAGDFVYRVSFAKPDTPGGYAGGIAQSTFRAESGHLAFEWRNSSQSGRERHITRIMKVRVREPEPPGAKAAGRGR